MEVARRGARPGLCPGARPSPKAARTTWWSDTTLAAGLSLGGLRTDSCDAALDFLSAEKDGVEAALLTVAPSPGTEVTFDHLAEPTETQRKAFELIDVPIPLRLSPSANGPPSPANSQLTGDKSHLMNVTPA